MAQNETWLKHDLLDAVKVQYLDGNLFSMDNAGNLIGVTLTRDGEDYSGGGSVSANVIRSDGGTVAVSGALSGKTATVVLPQAAYAVPGVVSIVVKLTASGQVTTIAALVANVYRSSTDTAVDPGTIIPSIQTLISQINTAVASIPADYSALWTKLAPAFSTDTSYVAGQYVTYNSGLYRFNTSHSGSWSSSDVTAVNLGGEISDLKSAFNKMGTFPIELYPLTKGNLSNAGTWNQLNANYQHCVVPVNGGESVSMKFDAQIQVGFVKSYSSPVDGSAIDYSANSDYSAKKVLSANTLYEYDSIPSDVRYIIVERVFNGTTANVLIFSIDSYDVEKKVGENIEINNDKVFRYVGNLQTLGITTLSNATKQGYYNCPGSYTSSIIDKPSSLSNYVGFDLIVYPNSAGGIVYQTIVDNNGNQWFRYGTNDFVRTVNPDFLNSSFMSYNGDISNLGYTKIQSASENGFYNCPQSYLSSLTDKPFDLSTGFIVQTFYPASGGVHYQILTDNNGNQWFRYEAQAFKRIGGNFVEREVVWYALGDSITQGYIAHGGSITGITTNNYVTNVAKLNGYEYHNFGIGGSGYLKTSTVPDPSYPDEEKYFNAKQKVDDIIASDDDFTKCDLVTLAYGVNDWHYSQQIGSVSDSKTLGTTMCSNMKYVIEAILDNNPMCKIIVLTPMNSSAFGGDFSTNWGLGHSLTTSGTLQDVIDAIISVCEYYGIEYIDQSKVSIVNRANINDCLGDGLHPEAVFYPIMAKDLASKINMK